MRQLHLFYKCVYDLTETYDVFKSEKAYHQHIKINDLTETYDVFKYTGI